MEAVHEVHCVQAGQCIQARHHVHAVDCAQAVH